MERPPGYVDPFVAALRLHPTYEPIDEDCERCKEYWDLGKPDVWMQLKPVYDEDEGADVFPEGVQLGQSALRGPEVKVRGPPTGPPQVNMVSRLRGRESKGGIWHSSHPYKKEHPHEDTYSGTFRSYNPPMGLLQPPSKFVSDERARRESVPSKFDGYIARNMYEHNPNPGPHDDNKLAKVTHHWQHLEQYERKERNQAQAEAEEKELRREREQYQEQLRRERAFLERAAYEARRDEEIARAHAKKRPGPEGKGKPSCYRDIAEQYQGKGY